MRAGAMKYRLSVLEPVRITTGSGAERIDYQERNIIHAERVSASGSRSDEVGEHFADYRAQFNIRDIHHIHENWRVRQLGGEIYSVVAIVPNIDRGFKTLICERVNE